MIFHEWQCAHTRVYMYGDMRFAELSLSNTEAVHVGALYSHVQDVS